MFWPTSVRNLRVISPEAVAEAAALKPAMVFSAKVLLHVHPDELGEYLHNIMTMIGTHGQAIIISKWNNGETLQYGGKGWAHGLPVMRDMVAAWGARLSSSRKRHIGWKVSIRASSMVRSTLRTRHRRLLGSATDADPFGPRRQASQRFDIGPRQRTEALLRSAKLFIGTLA